MQWKQSNLNEEISKDNGGEDFCARLEELVNSEWGLVYGSQDGD